MRLVVELVEPGMIGGWGVDDVAPSRPLDIDILLRGEVVATCVAENFRPDLLANNVGTGFHGFHATINSDLYLDILLDPEGWSVVGRGDDGRTVTAEVFRSCELPAKVVEFAGLRVIGGSYISDNLRDYNSAATRARLTPEALEDGRTLFGIKLQIFGDVMWWRTAEGRRIPSVGGVIDVVGPRTRALINAGKLTLLLDMSNEAPPVDRSDEWLRMLHEGLASIGVDHARCVFVSQNQAFAEDYRRWLAENGLEPSYAIDTYDYYLRRFASIRALATSEEQMDESLAQFVEGLQRPRSKAFVCLNFTPRPERLAFLSWLVGRGWDAQGYVSFKGFANHKLDSSEALLPDWFPDAAVVASGEAILRERGPMVIDVPVESGVFTPEFDTGPNEIYRDSWFSIVTESDVSDGDILRITEKTLKPAAMFHPFVVVGNPGALATFRAFGFRSFSPWIDESYDLITDPRRRMRAVQEEVSRLISLDANSRREVQVGIRDILTHNYIHLTRTLPRHYSHIIERALFARLFGVGSSAVSD